VKGVVAGAIKTVGQKLVDGVNQVLGTDLHDPHLIWNVGRLAVGGLSGFVALFLTWDGLRPRRKGVVRVP
jgi:hypothetical protein